MKTPPVIPGSTSGKVAALAKDASLEKASSPDVNDLSHTGNEMNKADWPFYLGLIAATLLFFAKTVFLGLSISKICRVATWDSMFTGIPVALGSKCDPSVVQLVIPYYFLLAKIWHTGVIPLWNPYSGFGCPLIGDVQATIFSPVRALFMLWPNLYVYNLTLVLQVVLAAIGTYGLCRALTLNRTASCFAALSYAFCPYTLWYLELMSGVSQSLFPLTAWMFVRLAKAPTLTNVFLAALVSSALIVSGHPESAFYGIGFSCLLMILLIFNRQESLGKKLGEGLKLSSAVGATTFCLSAPVLFPFVQYLSNSDSYKYAVTRSAFAPWQGIIYNLLQPGFASASPYAGIVAAACLIFALIVILPKNKVVQALTITGFAALVITSRLGPVDTILHNGVSKYFITVYCMPLVLLLAIVIAAFGVQEVVSKIEFGSNKRFLLLLACLLVALSVPMLLHLAKVPLACGNFDMILPNMSFNLAAWKHDLILSVLLVLLLAGKKICQPRYLYLLAAGVLAVSFLSQASLAKSSLPIESKFAYPVVEPIPFLQANNARVVTACDYLFRPNTNVVYGISEIQSHNPLYPQRYLKFMKALGAKVTEFDQSFAGAPHMSSLLNLAGVRYVLSMAPLDEAREKSRVKQDIQLQPAYFDQTSANKVRVYENTLAVPRAYVVHSAIVCQSEPEALKLITAPGFDYHKQVVIEGTALADSSAVDLESKDIVELKNVNANTVQVNVTAGKPGYLVLSDQYYPGWTVRVDGKPQALLRANYMFRAVAIAAGQHAIIFSYQPLSFYLGMALCLGILLLFAIIPVFNKISLSRRGLS